MKRFGARLVARHPLFDDRSAWARSPRVALVTVYLAASTAAHGQDAPAGGGFRFSSSVDTAASYVVNSRQGGREGGELVVDARPGFNVASRSGRVVGTLKYSLGLQQRTRNSDDSDAVSHSLAAQFSAEAVDRWLYIDGNAGISRQSTNPYGLQATGGSSAADSNRVEVATASLSPYVRGALVGAVNYELRLNASGTNARRSLAGDSTTWGGTASLSSQVPGSALGWGLVASSQETDYRASRSTRNDRWSASLNWFADVDLSFVLRGGEEGTNVGQPEQERYANWGGGVTWRPSPRTRFQLDGDKRYFGTSYRVVFEHRMASSAITVGSSRSDNGGQPTRVPITAYQLYDAQLATLIPDPGQRLLQVQALLQARNQLADEIVFTGFVNSAVSVVERHDVAFTYTGPRMSAGLQAYFDSSRVLDSPLAGNREPVRQKGYTASWGYRLSPSSSLAGGLTWFTTLPSDTRPGTNLKSASLTLSQQLGRRTSASGGLRYAVFNSSSEPYREAAITATLNHRF